MSKWGTIPSITAKRRARVAQYTRDRKWFLAEHPWCEWGLRQTPPVHIRSTEVHHSRGKVGRLLLDQRFWFAVSREGHIWIHGLSRVNGKIVANVHEARKLGLMCAVGLWNTPEPLSNPPAVAERRSSDSNPSGLTSAVKFASPSAIAGSDGVEN